MDRAGWGAPARALVEAALAAGRPPALPFGPPAAEARAALAALDDAALGGGRRVRDRPAVIGLRAGLWLLHDFMDESHELAQQIEDTEAGPYWHAIVHRREPDAGNARYWFGRVGAHPIFPPLLADARQLAGAAPPPALASLLGGPAWRPGVFVELCTGRPAGPVEAALRAIQQREWELLAAHEWRRAFGA